MRHALATISVVAALGAPAFAETSDVSDPVTGAWQDLQDRCMAAVLSGKKLNVAGLQNRRPNVFYDVIEDDLFFGGRVERQYIAPNKRTVPIGVWGTAEGRFELWLTEYPTRAGFRAICEVRQARGTDDVSSEEIAALQTAFDAVEGDAMQVAREGLTAYRLTPENPRGCPVVTSISTQYAFRSTVSETADDPDCGGPSLATDVITPHGVLPPRSGG
ncbi:MAG: hypothetical protein AAFO72_06770 [Pseudomonadota bacterium]